MVVVAIVALICVGLRLWPVVGVGLLLGASVSPASLIEKADDRALEMVGAAPGINGTPPEPRTRRPRPCPLPLGSLRRRPSRRRPR